MLRGMADMVMVGAGEMGDIILAPDGAISRAPWLR
jgi:hypothetical protein